MSKLGVYRQQNVSSDIIPDAAEAAAPLYKSTAVGLVCATTMNKPSKRITLKSVRALYNQR